MHSYLPLLTLLAHSSEALFFGNGDKEPSFKTLILRSPETGVFFGYPPAGMTGTGTSCASAFGTYTAISSGAVAPSSSQKPFNGPNIVTSLAGSQTEILVVPSGTDLGPVITVSPTAPLDPNTAEAAASGIALAEHTLADDIDHLESFFGALKDQKLAKEAVDALHNSTEALAAFYARLAEDPESSGEGAGETCNQSLFTLVGCALSTFEGAAAAAAAGAETGRKQGATVGEIKRSVVDEAEKAGLKVRKGNILDIELAIVLAAQSIINGPNAHNVFLMSEAMK